jgi:tetratricopeptide (TPR) repeat protein
VSADTPVGLVAEGDELARNGDHEGALARYEEALAIDAENTDALERKAQALLALGRTSDAIECHDRLVALHPDEAKWLVMKADLLVLDEQYDAAVACFEEALRLDPSDHGSFQRLGDVLRARGRTAEAIEVFDRAIRAAPSDATLWVAKGDALIDDHRADEAIKALETAESLDPQFSETDWNLRADRYFIGGDYTMADRFYRKAIERQPNLESWRGLAMTSYLAGRAEEALRNFDEVLKFDPTDADALNDRGIVLLNLGRSEEARHAFERLVEVAPDSLLGWLNLGGVSRDAGEMQAARDAYSQAARLDPKRAETWVELGLCEMSIGSREPAMRKALTSFERATELDPESLWGWNNAGWILGQLGEVEEAKVRLDRAILINPQEIVPWNNKTWLLLDNGDVEAAEACIEELTATVSNRAMALNVKSQFLTDWQGKHEEALALLREAKRLEPDDVSISANLAETLLKVGQCKRGRKIAEDVLKKHTEVDTRSAMLFVIYASYVLEGGHARARSRAFRDFMTYYRARYVVPPGRQSTWTYRGLDGVLAQLDDGEEKRFVLSLAIDLQEGRVKPGDTSFFAEVVAESSVEYAGVQEEADG